jgi:hypothetical protein
MKFWLDTEFNEYLGELISLALVAQDGREWYGVRHTTESVGAWVREHVLPVLGAEPQNDLDLRVSLIQFLAQYETHEVIVDFPEDIVYFCRFLTPGPGEWRGPDSMTFTLRDDLPDTSKTSAVPHNALEDARALMKGDRYAD